MRLQKSVLPFSGSKATNISSCNILKGTKRVRASVIDARNEKLPKALGSIAPSKGRFQEINRESRSPDNGASLEKRLGSSTLRINLDPSSIFNSFHKAGLAQNPDSSKFGKSL